MTFYEKILNFDKMKFKLNEKYIENTKNTNIGVLYINQNIILSLCDYFPISFSSQAKILSYISHDHMLYRKLLRITNTSKDILGGTA